MVKGSSIKQGHDTVGVTKTSQQLNVEEIGHTVPSGQSVEHDGTKKTHMWRYKVVMGTKVS